MIKRDFLKLFGLGSLALSQSKIAWANQPSDKWSAIRAVYELPTEFINLESGYYNIIPQPTLRAVQKHQKNINKWGSYYMRNHRFNDQDKVVAALAKTVGTSEKNLVLTRNTTESLNTITKGFPWKKGDHVVFARQDYGAMRQMFYQVRERFGIEITEIDVPMHPKNDKEVVDAYKSAMKPNTKFLMVCHMVNITGHILPIAKICDMAHKRDAYVMVDGAHCVGHFDFNIDDLNCDFYGSSLHKWLAAPLGTGLLYVNPKNRDMVWPLFTERVDMKDDIKRFSHIGTLPCQHHLAIIDAINYHNAIGPKVKENRLRELQRRLTDALRPNPMIVINTPEDINRSCAISNVGVKDMDTHELADTLMNEFGIFTVAISNYGGVEGCRISPNVFNTTDEIDQLIQAFQTIAERQSKLV